MKEPQIEVDINTLCSTVRACLNGSRLLALQLDNPELVDLLKAAEINYNLLTVLIGRLQHQ